MLIKGFIALSMAALLGLSPSPARCEIPTYHLFYDIPFTITPAQYVPLATEKLGITPVIEPSSVDDSTSVHFSGKKTALVFGQPAQVRAEFLPDGLRSIDIQFPSLHFREKDCPVDRREAAIDDILGGFLSVYGELTALYGPQTEAYLTIFPDSLYELPMLEDGVPDSLLLRGALENNPNVLLSIFIENVYLSVHQGLFGGDYTIELRLQFWGPSDSRLENYMPSGTPAGTYPPLSQEKSNAKAPDAVE